MDEDRLRLPINIFDLLIIRSSVLKPLFSNQFVQSFSQKVSWLETKITQTKYQEGLHLEDLVHKNRDRQDLKSLHKDKYWATHLS